MSKTLALTEELIALSSVTPDDNGCQRRLIDLLLLVDGRAHAGFSGQLYEQIFTK